jgi:hypothetical protein
VQGFRSVGPCGAGIPIVGGGATSDPTCATGPAPSLNAANTWTATQNFAGATFNTGAVSPLVIGEYGGGVLNALSLNGSLTPTGIAGLLGASSDSNVYYMVPTGSMHDFRVNNVDVATLDATSLHVRDTTASTSSITGSLINDGGFGNAGAGYFGGDLVSGGNLQVSGAGTFGGNVSTAGQYLFSGNSWASLQGNYVVLNAIGAGAAAINLGNSADAEIYFKAGSQRFQPVGGGSDYALLGGSALILNQTTQSTSTGTGALQVAGGAGIVGNTNIGGTLTSAGALTVSSGGASITAAGIGLFVNDSALGIGGIVLSSINGGGNYGSRLAFTDSGVGGVTSDISSIASGGLWMQFSATPYFKFTPGLGMSIEGTTASGSVNVSEVSVAPTIGASVTSVYNGVVSNPAVQAASFTVGALRHFSVFQGTIGAGAAVSAQYGYYADSSLTGGSQNFAFYSGISASSGRWAFYGNGTAASFLNGGLQLGGTPADAGTGNLIAVGSAKLYSTTTIPAGGITGSGLKFSLTTNFGVFFGVGAPTLSAAKGSIYLRSDGSATNNRLYVNTDGGTTWTAVTTAS